MIHSELDRTNLKTRGGFEEMSYFRGMRITEVHFTKDIRSTKALLLRHISKNSLQECDHIFIIDSVLFVLFI